MLERGERKMRRYLRKYKEVVREIEVVAGVRTRARAALSMATTTSSVSSLPGKKKIKKVVAATTTPYNVYELRSRRRIVMPAEEENSASPASCRPESTSSSEVVGKESANCSSSEVTSSDLPDSCCSSNFASSSSEVVKNRLEIVDPEVESAEVSARCFDCHRSARKESKIRTAESDEQDSSSARLPDTKSTVQIKMPSNSEIEEFFAAAENDLQKRFTEKYNFDIVKDIPLEGRYEWVPIKP